MTRGLDMLAYHPYIRPVWVDIYTFHTCVYVDWKSIGQEITFSRHSQ